MIKWIVVAQMLACLTAATALPVLGGCATGGQNVLKDVTVYVADAQLILDDIQAFANTYFALNPDVDRQAAVNAAISKVRAAADAALRGDAVAAFADLSTAWGELMQLVGPIGVREDSQAKARAAGPGGSLVVPRPLALGGGHG